MCGASYMLNNETIPRIIVKRKIVLGELSAKDSFANPDLCSLCVLSVLTLLQKRTKLRFSLENYQKTNYLLTKEENEIIRSIKRY